MNSTAEGDKLEGRIFALFQTEIAAGRFFAKSECCKVHRKKGYYSKDRETLIVFDISIEIFLPGSDAYSVLVLIECKNYTHAVPVDDAEESFAKIQQISGANVKGIIASTNCFQQGTLSYSRSKGIGLLRYFDESNFKWYLRRRVTAYGFDGLSLTPAEIENGLLSPLYQSRSDQFLYAAHEKFGTSISSLLLDLTRDALQDGAGLSLIETVKPVEKCEVEFVSRAAIESRADAILRGIGYIGGEVPLETLCAKELESSGLVVKTELPAAANGWSPGVLGRMQFEPLEITLFDDANWNLARRKFTLAHELGHHFLGHSRYIVGEYCEESDFGLLKDPPATSRGSIRRMEWQANCFASCVLLPRVPLATDFLSLARKHGLEDRGFGLLFVDNQKCNLANYYNITNSLRARYLVSRAVIKNRLETLGFLNDTRTTNT